MLWVGLVSSSGEVRGGRVMTWPEAFVAVCGLLVVGVIVVACIRGICRCGDTPDAPEFPKCSPAPLWTVKTSTTEERVDDA